MEKKLSPIYRRNQGPDPNYSSPLAQIAQNLPKRNTKRDTIRVPNKYKEGDWVSEDDFEAQFKLKGKNPKNYPQLSVQDYSRVKVDEKGPYVTKLND